MLYPYIFDPILKSVIWGGDEICIFKDITPRQTGIGESWEISQVQDNVSIVSNGELKGKTLNDLIDKYGSKLLGKNVTERFEKKFPLLIKFIDARDDLSIQVHPDDKLAKERHNSFGKTEMWYVVNAKKGATLYSGFEKKLTPKKYKQSVEDNIFTSYLAKHEVHPGDVFFLPAGRVHAIGAGCFIAEIQQTSDITYRIYDFNRKDTQGNPRELHTELAKNAIDYTIYPEYRLNYQPQKDKVAPLVTCPYFTTNLIEMDKSLKIDFENRDSFTIYICMQGKLSMEDDRRYKLDLKQGQTVLIPAESKFVSLNPSENCKLLETYIG
jgi:mannose-6-phosphate isomerase